MPREGLVNLLRSARWLADPRSRLPDRNRLANCRLVGRRIPDVVRPSAEAATQVFVNGMYPLGLRAARIQRHFCRQGRVYTLKHRGLR